MVQKSYIQVPFKEATKISILCQSCKTRVVIDLSGDVANRKKIISSERKTCTGCGVSLDSSFTEALVRFNYWLESAEKAEKSGAEISLVIDVPSSPDDLPPGIERGRSVYPTLYNRQGMD